MSDRTQEESRVFRWALPASVAAHVAALLIAIFGLPVLLPQPQQDEAVEVELVPPPEPEEVAEAEPPPEEEPPAEEEAEPEQEEAGAETPPAGDEAAPEIAAPILRPVFRFGEEDTGPRQSAEGNSAQDEQAEAPENEKQEAETASDAAEEETGEPPALTAGESDIAALPPGEADQAQEAEEQEAPPLEEVRTLFSRSATGDPVAMTAMGNLPRDVRGGRLCVTELREQLLNAWPPYMPDLLPAHRLESGTTIDVGRTAFRQNGLWYDLSYRCVLDEDATRVLSFAYGVGGEVPREDWAGRGLPSR